MKSHDTNYGISQGSLTRLEANSLAKTGYYNYNGITFFLNFERPHIDLSEKSRSQDPKTDFFCCHTVGNVLKS